MRPPQTSSDASAELPEGVSVERTEVTLYSDGKGSLTLALHNSAYVTYVISAVTVNTTAGDTIVTLSHEFSYGTSELEVDFAGVSGDVSGVTLVLAQKDAQDAYSGEVKIAVSEATQVYKRQAWTTARILRTAGFALLGLIVLEAGCGCSYCTLWSYPSSASAATSTTPTRILRTRTSCPRTARTGKTEKKTAAEKTKPRPAGGAGSRRTALTFGADYYIIV